VELIYWDHYYNVVLAFNLLVVVALFTMLRFYSGAIAHIRASDELLRKDNPAFGISLAGATFAITILLSGTIYGSPGDTIWDSIIMVSLFGSIGIGFMAVTRIIFDRLVLRDISLRDEIVDGNIAVAIADAGNVLATALILRSLMIWVSGVSYESMLLLLGGFLISQAVLTGVTLLYMYIFKRANRGVCIQEDLKNGNVAMSLKFSGQKIGAAFAITVAAQLIVYEGATSIAAVLIAWGIASVLAVFVWKFLCMIAERIILFRVNRNDEIHRQGNIALGALQAVISISIGLLLVTL
jgi:uncharacterized membrane protein YjfL (UPF0719 family)